MDTANVIRIDLWKLIKYIFRHIWLPIICAVIGFGLMFGYVTYFTKDTYTASATLYIYNGNPNVINYAYTSTTDLNSAVQLLDTYMVVIKSNKVMDAVVEKLSVQYPGITSKYITDSLSMGSVSETGVLRINSTTSFPQLSADICNGIVDIAPKEIIRVVSAGSIEVIDYAEVPQKPNSRNAMRNGVLGGLAGGVLACGLLLLMFLMNRKVRDEKELTDSYTPPVLAEIPREKRESKQPGAFLINENTPIQTLEAYNKLRMNIGFSLVGKRHIVLISSAIPGEGKSTIAANLAICFARAGKKTLLIDGDMRRGNQTRIFSRNSVRQCGLANAIIQECNLEDAIIKGVRLNLDLLLVGSLPPNPAELLNSTEMSAMLTVLESEYEIILMDMPPINVVSDPLILAKEEAGMLYVVRQNYSDHREIRKALVAAELSKIDILGFALYGESVNSSAHTQSRYYKKYYQSYYHQRQTAVGSNPEAAAREQEKWALDSKDQAEGKHKNKSGERRKEKA